MSPQCLIKIEQGAFFVGILCRFNFLEHIRMGAHRTLSKNNQTARQDIGAFHRNADWNLLIGARQIIIRPHADAFAAMHVHRVIDD